jgi:hypothetical protein
MKAITLLAILLTLSGCAQTVWTKSGSTEADLEKDTLQCQRDVETRNPAFNQPNQSAKAALASSRIIEDDINSCLSSKGWAASTVK